MATYREIKGLQVPYLDTDLPSAVADTEEGSVWYNSITGKLRAFVAYDTWATSGNLNTGRNSLNGAGTQTAAIAVGGPDPTSNVELYNGAGWSETTNINTAGGKMGAAGTQTAALIYGRGSGSPNESGVTELWNGSTWTEVADLGTARYGFACAGTSTAAQGAGGYTGGPASAVCE